ncbi:hypothetical protein QAD02_013750 [Eretmocerus hayati]|uniref:Uncharacterized protein n=1 Tax=Eretmocerus hayati TaxID=131215 RepID=A0ACC2P3C2_9HYME|nr:hypothetical protein QAD02_013750 [Eretmocerus hayati]
MYASEPVEFDAEPELSNCWREGVLDAGRDMNQPDVRRGIGSLHGISSSVEDFIVEINELDTVQSRLPLAIDHERSVGIQKLCRGDTCYEVNSSGRIRFILGDDSGYRTYIDDQTKCRSHSPASLDDGSISILSVDSDVCISYIVGNLQSQVLLGDLLICTNAITFTSYEIHALPRPRYLTVPRT